MADSDKAPLENPSKTPTWAADQKLGSGRYQWDDDAGRYLFVKPDGTTYLHDTETGNAVQGIPQKSLLDRLDAQATGTVNMPPMTISVAPQPAVAGAPAPGASAAGLPGSTPAPVTPSSLPMPPSRNPAAVEAAPGAPSKTRSLKPKGPGAQAKKASPGTIFNGEEELIQAKRPSGP